MRIVFFHKENAGEFERFGREHPFATIHQTYNWGEFQSKIKGREKFFALGVCDQRGQLRGTALLISQKLPLGKSWLYCPRGPLVSFGGNVADFLFKEIEKLARREKAVFLRIDPLIEMISDEEIALHRERFPGFRPAHASYQPEYTIKVDLSVEEAKILAQMKPKGRYNIRLAEKKGVKVLVFSGGNQHHAHNGTKKNAMSLEKGVDEFYRLLGETTERDDFQGHGKDFYQSLLRVLGGERASLFLAEYGGEIVAGIIVTFFGDEGGEGAESTYYFGASGNRYREVMAPYLLQWEAMKEAKRRGCRWYDMLGVAPQNSGKDHPLSGVTDFKKKFGGKMVRYMPAMECVYSPFWYFLMRMAKRFGKV